MRYQSDCGKHTRPFMVIMVYHSDGEIKCLFCIDRFSSIRRTMLGIQARSGANKQKQSKSLGEFFEGD